MAIDYRALRSITAREMIAALLRDGFFERKHRKGSHQRYQHPDGRRVTVAAHRKGDTFALKTLESMIEQARWNEDDLRRLKLL